MSISQENLPIGAKTYEYIYQGILSIWDPLFSVSDNSVIQTGASSNNIKYVKNSNVDYIEGFEIKNTITTTDGSTLSLGYGSISVVVTETYVKYYNCGELLKTVEFDLSGELQFTTPYYFNRRVNGSDTKNNNIVAFRMYDGELTAEQILYNHNVDKRKLRS